MKKSAPIINLSAEQIIQKLEIFCAYRERCSSEIIQKMVQLKVEQNDYNTYIDYLRDNNFFNEERYVASFVRGKATIKNWGKRKITQALQQKKIDSKLIQENIENLDEGVYFMQLNDLILKKLATLKAKDNFEKKQKLIRFAMQKGYELRWINEVLNEINL